MQLFDPDMLLETPAFGTRASGLAENEAALARFFRSFPDYDVVLHGHASDGKTLMNTTALFSLGGATIDNEWNYAHLKMWRALGLIWLENQARI